jgi:hypothetical protein
MGLLHTGDIVMKTLRKLYLLSIIQNNFLPISCKCMQNPPKSLYISILTRTIRTVSRIIFNPVIRSPIYLIKMHCSTNLSRATLCLVSTLATTQAFKVTYYGSTGCRSGAPVKAIQRPEQGCQDFQHGVSQSHLLAGDHSDASYYMVYFSDSECNPDNIIKKAELGKDWDSVCVDVSSGYKSFQVYDVCTSPGCLNG